VIALAKDYALAEAAKPALGHAGFTMVAVAALLAIFSAINATIYGNARLGYTLARDTSGSMMPMKIRPLVFPLAVALYCIPSYTFTTI